MSPPIILTVNSTHFYLLPCAGGLLLVDAGWELGQFTAQMKALKIPLSAIRWVMFTHHHPDHAGLVQNIKNLSGARLLICRVQIPYLENLRAYYAKKGGYEPLRVEKNDLLDPDRAALRAIGVAGEILETPGHSPDSISLLLEGGAAFIGDLPAPEFAAEESAPLVRASWQKLLAGGAQVFYHSHTPPFPAARIRSALAGGEY
jgi:glyoxylase-like metal-dependent hydrolase (beta-lactamase superfamily II)